MVETAVASATKFINIMRTHLSVILFTLAAITIGCGPGSPGSKLNRSAPAEGRSVNDQINSRPWASIFDTSYLYAANARAPLAIRIPRPYQSEDTVSFLHPSAVYYPNRFCGYRYWVAFTLNNGLHTNEYPFIRCSNDLVTWDSFPGSPAMLFFPLNDYRDAHGFVPAYWSDVFLFPAADRKLWCGIRGWYEATGHVCLWVTSTSNGAAWSAPVKIFEDRFGIAKQRQMDVSLRLEGHIRRLSNVRRQCPELWSYRAVKCPKTG